MNKIIIVLLSLVSGCSTLSTTNMTQELQQLDSAYQQSPIHAREQLQEIKSSHEKDARPWITSGQWSLKENDIARARIAFLQAKRLDVNNIDAYIGLGICADQQKQHPQAQTFYLQGLNIARDDLKLKNNLAVSYLLSKQVKKAITILKPIAATMNKLNTELLTEEKRLLSNLSLAYQMTGKPQLAYPLDKKLVGQVIAESNSQAAKSLFESEQP